ncbi:MULTISPECIES: hypothetical protein [Cryobacterium]|uniref:hypothetical protein n=1 Tax=unclassified Cryobacterium TaxID=2649013 RepID=UPI00158114D2|nr:MULTISPECIES: hypothetical protein [Cryobacterium]
MALDQSAQLDLLAELKLTRVPDRIRVATETLCQELIDAEATALIGASRFHLIKDATAYLAKSKSSGLDMSLGYRTIDLSLGKDQRKAMDDADLAFRALHDDRIANALVGFRALNLDVPRAEMTTVYAE